MQINRQISYQPFDSYSVTVGVTATQLSSFISLTKADLIDSFTVSVDAGAANNVFIGGQGVTLLTGLEIVRGAGPVSFVIDNQRQHYEVQKPVMDIAEMLQCRPNEPIALPFIIWDFSQIYMIAIAATNARVAPFRAMFI